MVKRYMDESRPVDLQVFNSTFPQQPPPTIWNANAIIKEAEASLSKPLIPKLEPISESKKILGKSVLSRIPLAYPSSSSPFGGLSKNEPLPLKAPVFKTARIPDFESMENFKSQNIKNKAAILIQRTYRKYKFKKKKNVRGENSKSPHLSSLGQKLSQTRSQKDSYRYGGVIEKKYMTTPECCRSLIFKDYLKEGSLFFPERESVLVFGGIDPHNKYGDGRNTGKNIFRYNSELNQWDLVGELPQPRHHHAVAFLKGKVYLAGGTDPRDDEQGKTVVVGTVWSFDPVSRAWYKESEMLTPRKNFGLTVINGKLLAVGGQDKDGRILSSVESYDPVTGLWEYLSSLNTERTGAAAAKYNDTVWVAGGMTSSRKTPLTSSVESYDAKFNIWTEQSSLRFPRCFGCLFAMNDTLYFIGGAGRASEKERTTSSCNAIDLWNPIEEEWKLHFAMSIPRHGHAVAYLGTQILIIGGVTTAYLRALTDVECFCCERKTWVRGLTGLPVPLSGHGAVTLPPASLM